jgi:two-component system chemotaxis response regulator CheY
VSKRVLIVDDSPVMRDLLEHATNLVGSIEVDHAEDGVAALQAVRQAAAPYDLVLIDLNMPLMDGMKLLRFLKEDDAGKDSVLAVVTTEGGGDTEAQARSLGAHYFLTKPVAPTELMKVLNRALT